MAQILRFFCPVNQITCSNLIKEIDRAYKAGVRDFILLMTTEGGEIPAGTAVVNYLKSAQINLTTHNFGAVDSMGVCIYAAGRTRLCTSVARFVLHRGRDRLVELSGLEEFKEKCELIKSEEEGITKILSAATGKSEDEIMDMMIKRTILSPQQAVDFGLVNRIEDRLFTAEEEANIINISTIPTG